MCMNNIDMNKYVTYYFLCREPSDVIQRVMCIVPQNFAKWAARFGKICSRKPGPANNDGDDVIVSERNVIVVGDNMLTALSVAHDCSMIDANDTVIHLTVLPPGDSRPAHVEYTYAIRKPELTVSHEFYLCDCFLNNDNYI